MTWQRGETWWKICRQSEVFFFLLVCLLFALLLFVRLFFLLLFSAHKTWWECKCQWVCYRGLVYWIVDAFRYRCFQRTPFSEKKNRSPNTLQNYRNIPKHAFLFLSHLELEKKVLLKERHWACYEGTQLKKDSSEENEGCPIYTNRLVRVVKQWFTSRTVGEVHIIAET